MQLHKDSAKETRTCEGVQHKFRKRHSTNSRIPNQYRGIPISDSELKAIYGDELPSVAVYGEIQVTSNMENFLRLLIGF